MVLPRPDVVGDEQVGARHLQRAHHGVELVVLDGDAASEGRVQARDVGRGDGAPAHGVKEGVEAPRVVEALARVGQLRALEDRSAGLDLPDDLEFLAPAVVLDRLEGDEMLRPAPTGGRQGDGGDRTRSDGAHDEAALPHRHELAGRRNDVQGSSDGHGALERSSPTT
jgi:hypothetical protein